MFDDFIVQSSAVYGIPAAWIRGVIQQESSFIATAVSNKGAIGLMQIMPATGAAYGVTDPSLLYDPATNIDVGTHLLADLRSRFGNDLESILSAYYSGGPNNWQTNPDVLAYVQSVIGHIEDFLQNEPVIVTAGTGAGLVILVLLFLWGVHKKKK
jgi:soluble lytic murein transglycosylase-like protein